MMFSKHTIHLSKGEKEYVTISIYKLYKGQNNNKKTVPTKIAKRCIYFNNRPTYAIYCIVTRDNLGPSKGILE